MEQLLTLCKCSILTGGAVLLLTLLRPALGRRYQARWRLWLWLALAAVLLLPLFPTPWTAAVAERAPIRIEVPPPAPIVIQTAPEPADESPALPPSTIQGLLEEPAAPTQPPPSAEPAVRTAAPIRLSLPAALRTLWLAGMAVFALYFAIGNIVFCRRIFRWSRPAPEPLWEKLRETACAMALRRTPVLLVSDCVKSPMVIGLLRPKLVLPPEDYGEQELNFILRHELTHCKRGDLWYKLLLLAANGVHWFNPLAYLLVREASKDLELTCDDAVVAGADRETRRAYSETLLASLHRQGGAALALSTHFYGGAKTMKERFQNILTGSGRKRGIAVLCAVLLLLAAVGLGVALTEEKTVPLTDEELAQWQEKLAEPGWNGFLLHMYSCPELINLNSVLYQGAGLDHELTDAERSAAHSAFFTRYDDWKGDIYSETFGEPWENRIIGIYAADLEAYLREYTGLGFEDLSHTRTWYYLEEYDSYYMLNFSTDTLRVEVLSGERQGDTLRLTVRCEQENRSQTASEAAGIPWEDGVLTITDGKVVSYMSPLYADAEAAAMEELMRIAKSEDADVTIYNPLQLYHAYRGEMGDYHQWSFILLLTGEDGESRTESALLLTRRNPDGTLETLEFSQFGQAGGDGVRSYIGMGYTFEEYLRYRYDYGLTLSTRSWSWPAPSASFYEDFPAGKAEWATDPKETAARWLQACGDSLTEAETVYGSPSKTPDRHTNLYDYTTSYQDMVLRCTTAGGRQVLVLLNLLTPRGREIPGYWSVAGYKVETGEDLPEPDSDYRNGSAQIRYTVDGAEREVTAGLLHGGTDYQEGAYTDYAYDIYIPQGWAQTPVHGQGGLATCWYPAAADRENSYLRIAWSGCATASSFYQSYLPQYEDTENNRRSLDSGAATAAWARGKQSLSGQTRYTESLWVSGGQGPFEVLWTSTDPALMAEMRAVAMTFALAGEDPPAFGEIEPVTLMGQSVSYPGYRVVRQQTDTEWIKAGTYLVLTPEGWAFRLEDYFQENAERVRSLMNASSSHYPAPFGDIRLNSLELAGTQDSGFPKEGDGPHTLFIYRADWAMRTNYEGIPAYTGGTVDEDGYWHGDGTPYLVLEADYKRGCISRSFLMNSEYGPDSEAFQRELELVESGLSSSVWVTELGIDNRISVTEHTAHPAIFYDSTVGELFAVRSSPPQS